MRSVPLAFPTKQPLTPSGDTDDSYDSRSSGLTRSTTSAAYTRPRAKSGGALLQRASTTGMVPRSVQSRYMTHGPYGLGGSGDSSSNSHLAEDDDRDDADEQQWGLEKGMELFEVSAKDDTGERLASFGLVLDLRDADLCPLIQVYSNCLIPS